MHDLLAGLRHARNRLGHRFARAIDVRHKGRAYPKVYPMVYRLAHARSIARSSRMTESR